MLQEWEPNSLRPEILSIVIITIAISVLAVVYWHKQKTQSYKETPKGFVFLVQSYINYIRNITVEILGPENESITPFFVFLFTYLLFSNLIGVFGFNNPTASYTVTFSLAFVTFIGTFVIGFKYQKLSYLKQFFICVKIKDKKIPALPNPIEIAGAIAPLISLSFRLWGNIFAGGLLISLWFYFTQTCCEKVPVLNTINLLGGLTVAPLHMYLDLLCGVVQALVFMLLTMVYWSLAKGEQVVAQSLQKHK